MDLLEKLAEIYQQPPKKDFDFEVGQRGAPICRWRYRRV